MSKLKSNDFLENMRLYDAVVETKPSNSKALGTELKPERWAGRDGLKHIGGYFDKETLEKIVLMKARLNLDNTKLLKLAIDDLWNKQKAKKAFND